MALHGLGGRLGLASGVQVEKLAAHFSLHRHSRVVRAQSRMGFVLSSTHCTWNCPGSTGHLKVFATRPCPRVRSRRAAGLWGASRPASRRTAERRTRRRFASQAEARARYAGVWRNPVRLHSSPGRCSPMACKAEQEAVTSETWLPSPQTVRENGRISILIPGLRGNVSPALLLASRKRQIARLTIIFPGSLYELVSSIVTGNVGNLKQAGPQTVWPGEKLQVYTELRHVGWGTWIRTKAFRVRVGSSTAKLSPNTQRLQATRWCVSDSTQRDGSQRSPTRHA